MLTDYTDYNTVRAVLGVGALELKDVQLMLPIYNTVIESGLDALSLGVLPNYDTIGAIPSGDRTALQARFYDSVQIYSAYLVAINLTNTLPIFAPKKITDGDASQERFDNPYKDILLAIQETLRSLGSRILAALAVIDTNYPVIVLATRVYASVSALGADPVTGG